MVEISLLQYEHNGAFMGCVAEVLIVVVIYGHENATPVRACGFTVFRWLAICIVLYIKGVQNFLYLIEKVEIQYLKSMGCENLCISF